MNMSESEQKERSRTSDSLVADTQNENFEWMVFGTKIGTAASFPKKLRVFQAFAPSFEPQPSFNSEDHIQSSFDSNLPKRTFKTHSRCNVLQSLQMENGLSLAETFKPGSFPIQLLLSLLVNFSKPNLLTLELVRNQQQLHLTTLISFRLRPFM